mgnify:CR=1 FL=1
MHVHKATQFKPFPRVISHGCEMGEQKVQAKMLYCFCFRLKTALIITAL